MEEFQNKIKIISDEKWSYDLLSYDKPSLHIQNIDLIKKAYFDYMQCVMGHFYFTDPPKSEYKLELNGKFFDVIGREGYTLYIPINI